MAQQLPSHVFNMGQTMSLQEMNELLQTGVARMNELKNTKTKLLLDRELCPHDEYACHQAVTLKQARDTIVNQRDIIRGLEKEIKEEQARREAEEKENNDPKYAEEFETIVCELNLRHISSVHAWAKRNGLKTAETVPLKWHERFFAWIMSH